MDNFTFRAATMADLPALVRLLADDELGRTREDASQPPAEAYINAMQAILADPNQLQGVVEEDGTILGTLQISFIPGLARKGVWRGQIEGVRIASSRRGSGLGEQLFVWAVATCHARGCNLVQLTTDKTRRDAHRFYEKLGFEATHEGYKLSL